MDHPPLSTHMRKPSNDSDSDSDSDDPPPVLVTRKQIERFRGLTYLLTQMSHTKLPASHKMCQGGGVMDDRGIGIDKHGFWRCMTSLTHILVRNREIVAMLPGTLTNENFNVNLHLTSGYGEDSNFRENSDEVDQNVDSSPLATIEPEVLLTENTANAYTPSAGVFETQVQKAKDAEERNKAPPKLLVTLAPHPQVPDIHAEMRIWEFLKMLYSTHAVDANGALPFHVHVQVVRKFLVAQHDSGSQTRTERQKLLNPMRKYILGVSASKIQARFQMAPLEFNAKLKNFQYFIAKADSEFSEEAQSNPEGLVSDPPTQLQLAYLKLVQKRMTEEELRNIYGHSETNPNTAWYDSAGRRRLLRLLRTLLQKARTSIHEAARKQKDLASTMKEKQRGILGSDNKGAARKKNFQQPEQAVKSMGTDEMFKAVEKTAAAALRDLLNLNGFIHAFGRSTSGNSGKIPQDSPLVKLLMWLQSAFDIQKTTGRQPATAKAPNLNASPSTSQVPMEDLPEQSGAATTQDDDDTSGESVEIENVYTNVYIWINGFRTQDNKLGWAFAAFRWLQLCCNHVDHLGRLEAGVPSDRVRKIIPRLVINVIHTDLSRADLEMENPAKIISRLSKSLGLKKSQRHMAMELFQKAWRRKSESRDPTATLKLDTAKYNGTYHCESILLSIHLLLEFGDKEGRLKELHYTEGNSIVNDHFEISADVIDKFKSQKLASSLAVSKRCCPACDILVKNIRVSQEVGGVQGKDILTYAGWHNQWFQSSLLPFLPYTRGQLMIHQAEVQLSELWRDMLEYGRENKGKPEEVANPAKERSSLRSSSAFLGCSPMTPEDDAGLLPQGDDVYQTKHYMEQALGIGDFEDEDRSPQGSPPLPPSGSPPLPPPVPSVPPQAVQRHREESPPKKRRLE